MYCGSASPKARIKKEGDANDLCYHSVVKLKLLPKTLRVLDYYSNYFSVQRLWLKWRGTRFRRAAVVSCGAKGVEGLSPP